MEVASLSRLHEMVTFDPTPHFIALLYSVTKKLFEELSDPSSTKFLGPRECFRDQKEEKTQSSMAKHDKLTQNFHVIITIDVNGFLPATDWFKN